MITERCDVLLPGSSSKHPTSSIVSKFWQVTARTRLQAHHAQFRAQISYAETIGEGPLKYILLSRGELMFISTICKRTSLAYSHSHRLDPSCEAPPIVRDPITHSLNVSSWLKTFCCYFFPIPWPCNPSCIC
jgi:hypothetical protein